MKWQCDTKSYQPTESDKELGIKFMDFMELIGIPIDTVYDKNASILNLSSDFKNDIEMDCELILSGKELPQELKQRIIKNRPLSVREESKLNVDYTTELEDFFT